MYCWMGERELSWVWWLEVTGRKVLVGRRREMCEVVGWLPLPARECGREVDGVVGGRPAREPGREEGVDGRESRYELMARS